MSNKSVSPEGLVRGIRRWDLVAVTINGIIGAGIFGLPSKVYALIGSYSLIAFIACALVVMLIILCFAEVGSRFEQTGGPYLYAQQAFGSAVAFEVGWLIWLARLTAFGQLQLDDQLSIVLLGAGECGSDSCAHYRSGRRGADSFECCRSSTGRDRQQHLYDWEARPDADLHRRRLVLYQSALVCLGRAAGNRSVFSIGFVAALRIHWIRDG